MAPRKGGSNELTRLLRAQSEPVVNGWIDDLLSKLQFRRKLPKQASREQLTQIAREIYDSLVTSLSSIPSKGNTRKLRLKKSHKKYIEALSLVELQQAQLILLDRLLAAVGKEYSAKPKKVQKYTSMLNQGIHDLILQTSKADLERRKKAAARAENKYARLLDMANDAILLMNFDSGLFVEANKAACELTGYSESELKQAGFNSLVSVFDLNLALEKANAAIEQGAVRFDDLSIYTKKGKLVPVDISASAMTVDGGKHILAIIRDIKERKKFEEDIKQKAERLQLINEIAKAISSAGLDIESVLTTILTSVAKVIKVEAGSVLKLEEGELIFMAALGEKAEYVKPFRLKLGQGIAGWVAENGEGTIVRDVHNDPRYYPEVEQITGFVSKSILAVPMQVGDKTVGVIELINKIGGRFTKKDLDLMHVISSFAAVALQHASFFQECKTARMRLSQLRSPVSSSRLAAVVAQEMKDPLGIMKNYVRILDDKLAATGMQLEELVVLSEEVDRITNIADQLLHFSEAYSEQPRETPLNLLIENSITSARERLQKEGISTELRLERSIPKLSVIPNQMKMVLSNLIKLAIAEMPGGGTLTVSTRRRDTSICIEFSSTGSKHTSAEAGELFLPSAVAKGLVPKGLGLYMVYNIIQGYGGDIEVKSSKTRGNVFRIRLPLETAAASSGASE